MISSNDPDAGSVSISVSGTGSELPVADISVPMTSLSFGDVEVGASETALITISNTGTAELSVSEISSSDSQFTFSRSTLSLSPGSSADVTVVFVPQEGGDQTGVLTISSNDPDRPVVTIEVAGVGLSVGPQEETPGPIKVDLNLADGNQGLTTATGVRPGSQVTIQLFAEDFPEVIGFRLSVVYDESMLSYAPGNFTPSNFIAGATPLDKGVDGLVDAGLVSLSGSTASGSGFLGDISFDVDNGFADSTFVIITEIGLSLSSGSLQAYPVRITARLLESSPADFDGDGSVGFSDFLLFAFAFGTNDIQCDLDGDGSVGFSDFLLFASEFGK